MINKYDLRKSEKKILGHSLFIEIKTKKMLLKYYYNWLYCLYWVNEDESIIFLTTNSIIWWLHIYDFFSNTYDIFLNRFHTEIYHSLIHFPVVRKFSLLLSLISEEKLDLSVIQDGPIFDFPVSVTQVVIFYLVIIYPRIEKYSPHPFSLTHYMFVIVLCLFHNQGYGSNNL